MLKLLLYVLLATVFLTAMLAWMIKKYYWGPDGRPPRDPDRDRQDKQ